MPRQRAENLALTDAQAFDTLTILHYLLYLPVPVTGAAERLPLVLFLHGAGERGSDLEDIKRHGLPKVIEAGQDFPFIVASPQCPAGQRWHTTWLTQLLDALIAEHAVDLDRIYITGLSMGGFGTWALALEQPTRFAAIAPICGGSDPSRACTLAELPIWAFHGALDEIVPLARSTEMVNALYECGGNPRFTVYPDAGHDSWTATYDNPTLYRWLLSHRRR